jgi:hypothetical protein
MAATPETVGKFIEAYGWTAAYDQATNTWLTGFKGDSSEFDVLMHLTDSWLYFAISPYVEAASGARCAQRLHHYLLRLNHAIHLAKFSVDTDGDVVITVEISAEDLEYGIFSEALSALCYYADAHYQDVLGLAQEPDYLPRDVMDENWAPDLDAATKGLEVN